MDQMIRNLYAKVVLGGTAGETIVKERTEEVNTEVNHLLETIEGLNQKDFQKYRDCALSVAVTSEERGFILGMRYAMQLFQECKPENWDDWLF